MANSIIPRNTFKQGQQLSTRSIGDHECIFTAIVIGRTTKTVTIKTDMDGIRRCKIHHNSDEGEFIFPFGRYSMAPIFRANGPCMVLASDSY